jgi:D-alanyl-D-alanine dipeptidase
MKRQSVLVFGVLFVFFLGLSAQAQSLKEKHDLVEVTAVNPHIRLDIRYATKNNFTGTVIYTSAKCFLRRAVAEKLSRVQQVLEKKGLGLKIYDGYRPRSAQWKLWSVCPNEQYVALPAKGSKHNRGASVDLTMVDNETGREVIMPSEFDDFAPRAHRDYAHMQSEVAKNNCQLLERAMVACGFEPYFGEWWHFNDVQWAQYELLDIPFEQLTE